MVDKKRSESRIVFCDCCEKMFLLDSAGNYREIDEEELLKKGLKRVGYRIERV